MSVRAIDLRRGLGVKFKDSMWVVFEISHVVKGKGPSCMQAKLKDVKTGRMIEQRFNPNERLEEIFFDRKQMTYLYSDTSSHVVMDADYEQVEIPLDLIGDKSVYLQPDMAIEVTFIEGRATSAELPNTVELEVVDTTPQVKGATATNQNKDAVLEGGAKIKVPPFVENGTVVKVDIRTNEYLSRV
ncbi:MAG: elongation factor P [Phycisphaerae bacterium]|nr:elongation factor P [Phycisphaerae bacterium]MDP7289156.1 elongation factor P [Phycisphaerae bacterium]